MRRQCCFLLFCPTILPRAAAHCVLQAARRVHQHFKRLGLDIFAEALQVDLNKHIREEHAAEPAHPAACVHEERHRPAARRARVLRGEVLDAAHVQVRVGRGRVGADEARALVRPHVRVRRACVIGGAVSRVMATVDLASLVWRCPWRDNI